MALRHGDDVEVYLARGRLLEGLGRLAEAAQSYEMALQGDAASTALRVRLVEVERRLGRYDHALAHVDAAMRHARVDTRWLLRRAQILEDAGRRTEARRARVEALTEAERLLTRRSSPAALAARGEALLALGRADDAARDLAQAVRRAPSLTHARQLLAEARRTIAAGEDVQDSPQASAEHPGGVRAGGAGARPQARSITTAEVGR
jgi:tetratricopeptide (TPR) repeat protein